MPRQSWSNNRGDARNFTRPTNPGFHSPLNPFSPLSKEAKLKKVRPSAGKRQTRGAVESPSITALLEQGADLYRQQRYKESAGRYQALAATGQRLGDASYGIGLCALQLGDQPTAEEWFKQALEADDPSADASYLLGQLCERRGDSGGAAFYYETAAQLGHGSAAERLASLQP